MSAYYNEIDPFAAGWLRELIKAGHIVPGDVDERSIEDVQPDDLVGYAQCHFFSGIAGWSHALRLAGWPDDRPVWTGSCPCQPFSVAGRAGGVGDERHLWPAFLRLITECRPPVVFGEQVASADGRLWLAGVRADLEGVGYAVGAADLCAAGVGAPHIRQRLYWVSNAKRAQKHEEQQRPATHERGWLSNSTGRCGLAGGLEDPTRNGRRGGRDGDPARHDGALQVAGYGASGFWSRAEWLPCRDGKARRAEPGIFPLAYGAAERVGRLRGYGNAIVAPLAAEFIQAAVEAIAP